MRRIFLFIYFTVSILFNCHSQTVLDTDALNNLNNVYLFSLKEYCKTLDSTKTKIVFVRDESLLRGIWPEKIINFEIQYLKKESEYIDVIKQSNGRATIVGISPFDFRQGEFSVTLIPFSATFENNNLSLGNGGGLKVYFSYTKEKKGFIFKSKKWYGN